MAGETISMIGTWMQQMAQGWVVSGLTMSAFTLGLVTFASSLPMLALSMRGGVVADRFDKRVILIVTQIVQALLACAIGWLVARGEIQVMHIVIAGMCLGISTAFEMPAASALVPELVGREHLSAAIAVDRSLFHATRLAGPAVGGWLIARMGTASAFYANAASFGALILALLTLHPRKRGTDAEEAERQTGMKEGIAYVRGDRPTLAMLALLASSTICISPFFMIMMPLYSRHVLHIPANQHGILMASSGIGAFIGSLWLLRIPRESRAAWMRAALAAIVLAMLGLAAAHRIAEAMAAMIVLTLGTSTIFGLANTVLQERAPDPIRGRVSAIAGMSFFGVLPFAGLAVTRFADAVGLRIAMSAAACAYAIAASCVLLAHQRSVEKAAPSLAPAH
jgi:MFS family permease